jgi:hypothetical protein
VIALVVAGCAATPHVPVDLQLDIEAAAPLDATAVRLCMTDGPSERFATGSGRYALTGIPTDVDAELTVDVMGELGVIGRVGPVSFADADYASAPLDACGDGCDPCGSSGRRPPQGADAWTVGVRFVP